jgi:hypothetical protein
MSPARVQGHEYSFEADFWSLGITMIVALTNQHPYPLTGGMWVLTKAILESPTPALRPSAHIGADVCNLVARCLNAPLEDPTFAEALLQHPFILSAKARGVVSDDAPAKLTNPAPYLRMRRDTPESRMDRIVEIALSWQLERWAENAGHCTAVGNTFNTATMLSFSQESIALLASQMSVDPQVLQAKFREKYDQIDALCQESWSLEGLRREMWPVAGEKKLADHVGMRAPRHAFTVDVERNDYPWAPLPTAQLVIPQDLGMQEKRQHGPAATAVTTAAAATAAMAESKTAKPNDTSELLPG